MSSAEIFIIWLVRLVYVLIIDALLQWRLEDRSNILKATLWWLVPGRGIYLFIKLLVQYRGRQKNGGDQ